MNIAVVWVALGSAIILVTTIVILGLVVVSGSCFR